MPTSSVPDENMTLVWTGFGGPGWVVYFRAHCQLSFWRSSPTHAGVYWRMRRGEERGKGQLNNFFKQFFQSRRQETGTKKSLAFLLLA